ncbi:MAG: hypothetical protein ACFFCO_11045, partial [Promethearchaeota archaeon]
ISIDGVLVGFGPWNGSDISFTFYVNATGTWVQHDIVLLLHDVCGHRSENTVRVDVLPIDNDPPLISGPEDFWVLETEPSVSLCWEVYDLTPWNYSVEVNGAPYLSGSWIGSEIVFSFDIGDPETLEVKIVICDFFGHHADDVVLIEVRPVPSGSLDPLIQLSLMLLIVGTCSVLTVLLLLVLKKSRPSWL